CHSSKKPSPSSGFYSESRHPNREGTLDEIEGNHQGRLTFFPCDNSLNPIEAAADNPHSLPDIQKCIRPKRNSCLYDRLDGLNLFLGNGSSQSPVTYKTHYAFGS